jgi:hypothetical protein
MLVRNIDFLADPGTPFKNPDFLYSYNYILSHLNPGRYLNSFVTDQLWKKLTLYVSRLNEEKYKQDGMPPGAKAPPKEKLEEL